MKNTFPFTVIGYFESTGKILFKHVYANDGTHAFAVVAKEHPDAAFTVAITGFMIEGSGVELPGESVVYAETVLEQPEVFGKEPA